MVLANIILAFQHLQPMYYIQHSFWRAKNLVNNRPFAKFTNFTPANIFHYTVVGPDRISPLLSLLHPTPRKKYELAHETSYALVGGAPEAYSSQFMSLCTCMCVCVSLCNLDFSKLATN